MKTPIITKLSLLAEIQRLKVIDDISRQNQVLNQTSRQRQLLAEYRDKLQQSWRGGEVIEAAAARRAVDFVSASMTADTQIDQMEHQAVQAIEMARITVVRLKDRQHRLDEVQRSNSLAEERLADLRRERAQALAIKARKP